MSKLHSKQKGNIAEAAVILELNKQGYSVFREIGDLSKVDLIAEKDCKLLTFQVKGVTPKNGVITLSTKKAGPNYRFKYQSYMFNYFAVVNLETLQVAFINSSICDKNKCGMTLKISRPKNNQSVYVFSDFCVLDGSSETIRATRKWDDIVQTTTETASES